MSFAITNRITKVGTLLCSVLVAVLIAGCTAPTARPRATDAPSETPTASAAPAATAQTPEPTQTPDIEGMNVVISELMASNKTCIRDEDGDFSDWVELYNAGDSDAVLDGFWLSDKADKPQKWQIPALTIAPGEYKIIFLTGKDKADGELHAGFSISRDGDAVYLTSPMGYTLDSVEFGEMEKDTSLYIDGESTLMSYNPTPGYPNTEEGREAFINATDNPGELVVNEIVTHNSDYLPQAGGKFYDWIEIKNIGGSAVNLSEYYITDDLELPTQYQLPNYMLYPGQLFMLFLGEPEYATNALHAPFGMDCQGDSIYIFRADGTLSDCMSVSDIPLNCSKGRMDGQKGFFIFGRRSPENQNSGGYRFHCDEPSFITEPGIYNDVESVQIELSGSGTIRYTLDGNVPSLDSPVYNGPITLTATTAVRAACFQDGKQQSDCVTASYIINEYHTLPVVSVALRPGDYTQIVDYLAFWDIDASLSYFGPEGTLSSDCAISLHGASSRTVFAKKSYKFIFKDRYGGDVTFDMFGNGETEYHSILMRGQDSVGMHTFRDPLASLAANEVAVVDPLTLDAKFVILYVNGRYKGIYNLREAYSEKYVANHTGSDEEACRIVRAQDIVNDYGGITEIYNYICNNDLSDPDKYQYAADRFDMQSLAQWMLLEGYCNNNDPTGNIRYCVGNKPDGKWRVMFFDLDQSMNNKNAFIYNLYGEPCFMSNILLSVRRSESFRTLVLETAAQLRANGLNYQLFLDLFDKMIEETAPEMDRNLRAWEEDIAFYPSMVQYQRSVFCEERDISWTREIQAYVGASDDTMRQYFPEFY